VSLAEKTAVLLIGFGGPQNVSEIRPFLESVLEGASIPAQRFDAIVHRYEGLNGVSPYNALTELQKKALERWLSSQNASMPVGVGFRHSKPAFRDVFETFKKYQVRKVIGFVLASFRSHASFEKYQMKLSEAQHQAGAESIQIIYTDFFYDHPLYLEAQSERVLEVLKSFSEEEKQATYFLFSAHSIPLAMCEKSCATNSKCCYGSQFYKASASIAKKLGLGKRWSIAYQSRSGQPTDLWLEPDVKEVIQKLDSKKFKHVFSIPLGFLCDNVEVIYDLDVELKQCCEESNFQYFRASTVSDHPKFIEMMGRQILEKM